LLPSVKPLVKGVKKELRTGTAIIIFVAEVVLINYNKYNIRILN